MHDEMRIGGKKLMELVKKQQQKLEVTINFLCSTVKNIVGGVHGLWHDFEMILKKLIRIIWKNMRTKL
jgi:hypothetical protein